MRSWHPLSKLTVFLGLGALTAVWWLDHGAPSDSRVAAALPAATASPGAAAAAAPPAARHATAEPAPTASVEPDPGTRLLPPVDAFTSMVDRPLFAPARRPLEPAVQMAELEAPTWTVEPAAAPSYPSVSFVGSIEENGRVRALLGDGLEVRGVGVGEAVEGWTVLAIEARRLTLGHDGEILELTILE